MPLAGQGGFTLLEVLIAAILLTCVSAATTTLTLVSGDVIGSTARSSLAHDIASSTIERLRSIPFAQPCSTTEDATSVVLELFPHAIIARNQDDAYVSLSANGDGATFTTRHRAENVTVTVEATFVRSTQAGWRPVTQDVVEGFVADEAALLPSDALSVVVSVQWAEGPSPHVYTLAAIVAGDR